MEKKDVCIITDDMLEPYFLVAEKGRIVSFKKKTRNKKDGTQEVIKVEIATANNVIGALKPIVEDAFSSKKKVMLSTGEYIKAYREMLLKLKEKFKIEGNEYI